MAFVGKRTVQTAEGSLTTADGHVLYTKTWEAPPGEVKAGLVWLHGFSDHCNLYDDFFCSLASHGITVFAYDQRGWGRSARRPSERGLAGPTQTVLSDMTDFIDSLPPTADDVPLFLGGHSMGGAVCLLWASKQGPGSSKRRRFRGYVLEAPYLQLHKSVDLPGSLVWLVRGLAWCFPDWRVQNQQRADLISRSQKAADSYRDDPLNHGLGSLRCIADTYTRGQDLARGAHDLCEPADGGPLSLWIGHGNRDRLVSYEASHAYFDRSGIRDKHFETYESCYHGLHLESDRDRTKFASDVIAWISKRVDAE